MSKNTAGCFFYINHPTEWWVSNAFPCQRVEGQNAAVEWISLARQSHHVQLPAKMLTQQFHNALPVSDRTCQNSIIIVT